MHLDRFFRRDDIDIFGATAHRTFCFSVDLAKTLSIADVEIGVDGR